MSIQSIWRKDENRSNLEEQEIRRKRSPKSKFSPLTHFIEQVACRAHVQNSQAI
uniref:Uncharacterized protein n=1 Tax=Arundo donax TaxID=35708 RepID=A0A0A9BU27_ARUDO